LSGQHIGDVAAGTHLNFANSLDDLSRKQGTLLVIQRRQKPSCLMS
jgi:hypothetical protein